MATNKGVLDNAVQALRAADKQFDEATGSIEQLLYEIQAVKESAEKAFWADEVAAAGHFRKLMISLQHRLKNQRERQTKYKAEKDKATTNYQAALDLIKS